MNDVKVVTAADVKVVIESITFDGARCRQRALSIWGWYEKYEATGNGRYLQIFRAELKKADPMARHIIRRAMELVGLNVL